MCSRTSRQASWFTEPNRAKVPSTRIFVTGRSHIRAEIGKRLAGRVTSVPTTPRRDDITSYLHSKLDGGAITGAMKISLEAGILRRVPDHISEMYVEAQAVGGLS